MSQVRKMRLRKELSLSIKFDVFEKLFPHFISFLKRKEEHEWNKQHFFFLFERKFYRLFTSKKNIIKLIGGNKSAYFLIINLIYQKKEEKIFIEK